MSSQTKMWTCEACNKTCSITNKTNHLRTQKHINKENETGIRIVRRPRIYPISNFDVIINPVTKRSIKINGQTFRNLRKKYDYDEVRNKFLMHVLDPKNQNKKLVKNMKLSIDI